MELLRTKISIRKSVKDKTWDFDELAEPFFHRGSDTGCLLMHGFGGTPATVRPVADVLAEEGFTVYAPLLRGHGTTLGDMDSYTWEDWLNDARSAYERLKAEGVKSIVLMGFSMGGVLMSLLAEERECAGLVLMSAPFRVKRYIRRAAKLGRFIPYAELRSNGAAKNPNPYLQSYKGVAVSKLRDLSRLMMKARGGLYKIACPVLILQSALDNKVDLSSVDIVKHGVSSEDKEVIWLENSPHGCVYGPEQDKVKKACLEFAERISNRDAASG